MGGVRGILVAGQPGSGKTTVLEALHKRYAIQVPVSVTTRHVDSWEFGVRHLPEQAFRDRAERGDIVCPVISAGFLYGWEEAEFEIVRSSVRFAATVRGYTALVLASTMHDVVPVWLDVNRAERLTRIRRRAEIRDMDQEVYERRLSMDDDEARYRDFFPTKIGSDVDPVKRLAGIYDDDDR